LFFFSNRCTSGLSSVKFSSRVTVLVNLNAMRDGMRATYSRRAASKNSEVKKDEQPVTEKVSRAASKNSEVKKDEQPVTEKVSMFPLVLILSDCCSFVSYHSVCILGRCC
jgi:exodeoxyribonuclease III